MRWFRRLAEVPGVSYKGSSRVDRRQLPGYDHEPTVEVYEFDGATREYVRWPSLRDGSSISPASRHAFEGAGGDACRDELLKRLEETLELPGEPRDYHFAIQAFCEAMYKLRRDDPSVLVDVERCCLVDVELVEAYSRAVQNIAGEFYGLPSYRRLIILYEREGFLREAHDIAERGFMHGQDLERKVEELRERIAALEAEEAS